MFTREKAGGGASARGRCPQIGAEKISDLQNAEIMSRNKEPESLSWQLNNLLIHGDTELGKPSDENIFDRVCGSNEILPIS